MCFSIIVGLGLDYDDFLPSFLFPPLTHPSLPPSFSLEASLGSL